MISGTGRRGFTLIELLIVVAIIGIISAIAIPNLMTAVNKAKQKRTLADMRALAIAIESYSVDVGGYPPVGGGFDAYTEMKAGTNLASASVPFLVPTYVKKAVDTDAWNYPLRVGYDVTHQEFGVMSYGKDGALGPAAFDYGPIHDFRDDIVFLDGSFVKYPDGFQQ